VGGGNAGASPKYMRKKKQGQGKKGGPPEVDLIEPNVGNKLSVEKKLKKLASKEISNWKKGKRGVLEIGNSSNPIKRQAKTKER